MRLGVIYTIEIDLREVRANLDLHPLAMYYSIVELYVFPVAGVICQACSKTASNAHECWPLLLAASAEFGRIRTSSHLALEFFSNAVSVHD